MPLTRSLTGRPVQLTAAALALFGIGAGAGAVIARHDAPVRAMAPIVPVAIRSLPAEGLVSIRGRVEQVYGTSFVVADGSGRALVEAERRGESQLLVKVGQPVIVQGSVGRGVVHPSFLGGPDRRVIALGGEERHGHRHGGHDERPAPASAPTA